MVRNTGMMVQKMALTSVNQYTGAGCTSMAAGRSTKNWAMQAALDTHIAYATSRVEPMRLTSSPEKIRYSA